MGWDTIVIGSGVGGLSAAVALARAGQTVLVLEQHYLPGGWTHSFTLEGYSFSPGVHYIGDLGSGGGLRHILEGLGVARHLAFRELAPEGFDHLLIAGDRFDIPRGRDRYLERLKQRFPGEERAIDRYFTVTERLRHELIACDEYLTFPAVLRLPLVAPNLCRWGLRPLSALHRHAGVGPELDDHLSARCGNHGVAPSRASVPVHAAMTEHYMAGGYYPVGGGRSLAAAFIRKLRAHGGQILVRRRVRRILVEGGAAVGVELQDGEKIRARQVISNVDATITYRRLLAMGAAPWQRLRARRVAPSVSALSLFAAVDMDLAARGFDSGNYWWFRKPGVGASYERMARELPERVDGLFLSVSSLKDPSLSRRGHHTVEMFTFTPHAPFAAWAGTTSGERGRDYQAVKRRLEDAMLDAAGRIIPGFRDHLVFSALGTPLTNDHYCATPNGACYGIAKTPWQVGPGAFSTTTPVRGLYLCGASTLGHGITTCAISGLIAAKHVLGLPRADDCLRADGERLQIVRHAPCLGSVAEVVHVDPRDRGSDSQRYARAR